MIVKEFYITNEHGLHARPASLFCDTASRFKSEIRVFHGRHAADGKNVVSVLMLQAYSGSCIKIVIEGPDEKEAVQALTELIGRNFYE